MISLIRSGEFWAYVTALIALCGLRAFAADLAPPQMPALPAPVAFGCDCEVCDCGTVCKCSAPSVLVPRAHEAIRETKPKQAYEYTAAKVKPKAAACAGGQCGGVSQRTIWRPGKILFGR